MIYCSPELTETMALAVEDANAMMTIFGGKIEPNFNAWQALPDQIRAGKVQPHLKAILRFVASKGA